MIQITSITRGYDSEEERAADIIELRKQGFDHFVEYRDTAAEIALCYGKYQPPKETTPIPRRHNAHLFRNPGFDSMHDAPRPLHERRAHWI